MKEAILAFVRAVFWGSLAGGGPFLVLTMLVADWSQPEVIWVALMPILIAASVVALAAIFLGLPLTAWLAHRKDEGIVTYAIAGLGLGILLPIAFVLVPSGDWTLVPLVAIPGALAGTVTGTSWGRWREQIVDGSTHL